MQSSRACGPPEARQLRVWQRLGQLEDARHVTAVASQIVVVEAVSEGGEQLSASKADDGVCREATEVHAKFNGLCRSPEARQLRLGQRLGQLEDATHIIHEISLGVVVVATE